LFVSPISLLPYQYGSLILSSLFSWKTQEAFNVSQETNNLVLKIRTVVASSCAADDFEGAHAIVFATEIDIDDEECNVDSFLYDD